MNAYELADELQELDAKLHLIVLFKSAEMLRQQADQIAELEKLTREPTKVFAVPDLMAKAGFFKRGERVASQIQTKPLSDEEIRELIVNKTTDYELCRAIEERHGIK